VYNTSPKKVAQISAPFFRRWKNFGLVEGEFRRVKFVRLKNLV